MKLLLYLLILLLAVTSITAEEPVNFGTPPWQPLGQYTHNAIRESSGIVASRQFEGVYLRFSDADGVL